jgi:hypothetical protein
MNPAGLALRCMRVPRASLRVRRRREQYWDTGPEGAVLAATSGVGGAGLRPAGAAAGKGRA